MAHLFAVPAGAGMLPAEPTQTEAAYDDDDLRLVPVRLLLAVGGRCSCDDCCRAWLSGDTRAGIVEMERPRLRLVGG